MDPRHGRNLVRRKVNSRDRLAFILTVDLCVGAPSLNLGNPTDLAAEAALIERCRRRDMEAFGKLIDRYQHRVYGFVRRMVLGADEADDVTQEVFIRAFQAFDRFDGRCSVRTWLFRIAYNLCVDRSRRRERSHLDHALHAGLTEEQALEVADARWEPERLVFDEELQQVVEKAVAAMSEKLRSVLLLHDREDMPYEEIAQTLGVPIGTVKSRLFLARAQLKGVLTEYMNGDVGC